MNENTINDQKTIIAELNNEIQILRKETFIQASKIDELNKEVTRLISMFINMKSGKNV